MANIALVIRDESGRTEFAVIMTDSQSSRHQLTEVAQKLRCLGEIRNYSVLPVVQGGLTVDNAAAMLAWKEFCSRKFLSWRKERKAFFASRLADLEFGLTCPNWDATYDLFLRIQAHLSAHNATAEEVAKQHADSLPDGFGGRLSLSWEDFGVSMPDLQEKVRRYTKDRFADAVAIILDPEADQASLRWAVAHLQVLGSAKGVSITDAGIGIEQFIAARNRLAKLGS